LLCRLALDSYGCRERESVGNQGLCPTFKWRRNLPSFYRAGVSLEKHQSTIIGKTVPQIAALDKIETVGFVKPFVFRIIYFEIKV